MTGADLLGLLPTLVIVGLVVWLLRKRGMKLRAAAESRSDATAGGGHAGAVVNLGGINITLDRSLLDALREMGPAAAAAPSPVGRRFASYDRDEEIAAAERRMIEDGGRHRVGLVEDVEPVSVRLEGERWAG